METTIELLTEAAEVHNRSQILWHTPVRRATWDRLNADTNHPWRLRLLANANNPNATDWAQCGFAFQLTSDRVYAAKAYNILSQYFNVTQWGKNEVRAHGMQMVAVYSWIMDTLTATQRSAFANFLSDLASVCLVNSSYMPVIGDFDETGGIYFFFAAMDICFGTGLLDETLADGRPVGGVIATGIDDVTLRNSVANFCRYAEGGLSPDGPEYAPGDIFLYVAGADLVHAATGMDHFPEVTALAPQCVSAQINELTNNHAGSFQWSDIDTPRGLYLEKRTSFVGLLAGLTDDAYAYQLADELFAVTPAPFPYWYFYLADPYAERRDWRTNGLPRHLYVPGMGTLYARDRWDGSGTAIFMQMPPQIGGGHAPEYLGDFQMYGDGEWLLTRPIGYGTDEAAFPFPITAPNTMNFFGISCCQEGRGSIAHYADGGYFYLAGSEGGQIDAPGSWTPFKVFIHGHRRSISWLPDGNLVVYDVTSVEDPRLWPDYSSRRVEYRNRIDNGFMRDWRIHSPVQPSSGPNTVQWTTPAAKSIKLTTLLPVLHDLIIEADDEPFAPPSENKWHTIIRPIAQDRDINLLHVVSFNTDPIIPLSAGQMQGCCVGSTCVLFSAKPFPDVPTYVDSLGKTVYDLNLLDRLAWSRWITAGFSFTLPGSFNHVYLHDLDPGLQWTMNGNPLVVSPDGVAAFDATGAITIAVTGTPSPEPPSRPSSPPGLPPEMPPVPRENSQVKVYFIDAPTGFLAAIVEGLPAAVKIAKAEIIGVQNTGWKWQDGFPPGAPLVVDEISLTWENFGGNPNTEYTAHIIGSDSQEDTAPVEVRSEPAPVDWEAKFHEVEARITTLESELTVLQTNFGNLGAQLTELNEKLSALRADIQAALVKRF